VATSCHAGIGQNAAPPLTGTIDPDEAAGELSAGEAVLVAGKLKWTSYTAKDGSKNTGLAVLARLIQVLALAAGRAGNP